MNTEFLNVNLTKAAIRISDIYDCNEYFYFKDITVIHGKLDAIYTDEISEALLFNYDMDIEDREKVNCIIDLIKSCVNKTNNKYKIEIVPIKLSFK